ncbi:hypothetical protein [Aquisalimonas asiatica]|uniref:Uncharacterized protein n=1 Tax=Aquisalimonas asiatica TaxID=406100 RepID=A0A1H8QQX0_9GAMM|nr:hypothetical protein [Aquisalimonas asiatica]SEO56357.1 hypothetical protein SAMN04488052_101717 [Aquisalimonas asiatica]
MTKEMGLREAEFVQALPAVLAGYEWQRTANRVTARKGTTAIHLEFGPEQVRRIASVALPLLPVTLTFVDCPGPERQAFLDHFNRRFQRGGG